MHQQRAYTDKLRLRQKYQNLFDSNDTKPRVPAQSITRKMTKKMPVHVVIIVSTAIDLEEVLRHVEPVDGTLYRYTSPSGEKHYVGKVGELRAAVVLAIDTGPLGPVGYAAKLWNPSLVLSIGSIIGIPEPPLPAEQRTRVPRIGDVLISNQVWHRPEEDVPYQGGQQIADLLSRHYPPWDETRVIKETLAMKAVPGVSAPPKSIGLYKGPITGSDSIDGYAPFSTSTKRNRILAKEIEHHGLRADTLQSLTPPYLSIKGISGWYNQDDASRIPGGITKACVYATMKFIHHHSGEIKHIPRRAIQK